MTEGKIVTVYLPNRSMVYAVSEGLDALIWSGNFADGKLIEALSRYPGWKYVHGVGDSKSDVFKQSTPKTFAECEPFVTMHSSNG